MTEKSFNSAAPLHCKFRKKLATKAPEGVAQSNNTCWNTVIEYDVQHQANWSADMGQIKWLLNIIKNLGFEYRADGFAVTYKIWVSWTTPSSTKHINGAVLLSGMVSLLLGMILICVGGAISAFGQSAMQCT